MSGVLDVLLPYVPFLALALRIWVGVNYVVHGYPKLGKMKQQVGEWMKSLGLPPAAGHAAGALEFFGGLSLIIGFIVPIVAFFFAIQMASITLVKITKMKAPYIAPQNPMAYELDITYFLLAITLMVLGAGPVSVDSLLGLTQR